MATGKELVRLTECGLWKDLISKDVKEYYFYDAGTNKITRNECIAKSFCSIHITLKTRKYTKKYLNLLNELCRLIASTSSEYMFSEFMKKRETYILIIN